MCGRFALYAESAKVARFLQGSTPQGVKWLSTESENHDEKQGLLKPANGGTLDPVSKEVAKVTNDGDNQLDLDIE
jgi:putative SOS response-associated peptidase YedK